MFFLLKDALDTNHEKGRPGHTQWAAWMFAHLWTRSWAACTCRAARRNGAKMRKVVSVVCGRGSGAVVLIVTPTSSSTRRATRNGHAIGKWWRWWAESRASGAEEGYGRLAQWRRGVRVAIVLAHRSAHWLDISWEIGARRSIGVDSAFKGTMLIKGFFWSTQGVLSTVVE